MPARAGVAWRGPADGIVRLLYQTVLREGTTSDVDEYVHLPTLLAVWDTLWLPAAVHDLWDPWIAAHRHPDTG